MTAQATQEKTLGVDVFQALFDDNQNLEDLAAACADRSRWEFMLVVAPLKLIGGTASMVNPIAIF